MRTTAYALSLKTSTASVPVKIVQPTQVFRAAGISHLKLGGYQAAQAAARWLDGRAIVLPTITLACDVFGTYHEAVVTARGCNGNHPKTSLWTGLLARSWLSCGAAERADFVRAYEDQVWAALEHVTDASPAELEHIQQI